MSFINPIVFKDKRYVMLCYVMLCYVMLCYVMLCYVMLCYVMLCYVMLCYVMLGYCPGDMAVRMRHWFHGRTQGVGGGEYKTIFKFCCARRVNWGGRAGIRFFPFGVF